MKKEYSTPFLNVERFAVGKSIAANCIDPTLNDLIESTGLFNAPTEACTASPEDFGLGDMTYEGMCYHTIDVSFGSNA